MLDMRRLALLYQHMNKHLSTPVAFVNMFHQEQISSLEWDIEKMSTREEDVDVVKSGLKIGFRYLIPKVAKLIQAFHLVEMNDSSAKEIDNFLKVFHLKQSTIFGDAEYQANTNKQKLQRKPAEMADDEDLAKFNDHVTNEITRLTDPYRLCDKKDYVTVRNVTVSRLTVSNARRGGVVNLAG